MTDLIKIFDDYEVLLKKFRKTDYIKNMEVYRNKYDEEITLLAGADSDEFYEEFVNKVYEKNKFFGKVSKMKRQDLGLCMIYFVFPAMLLKGKEINNGGVGEACEKLLNAWNKRFETDISYVDYDTLLAGFNEKLFGVI